MTDPADYNSWGNALNISFDAIDRLLAKDNWKPESWSRWFADKKAQRIGGFDKPNRPT